MVEGERKKERDKRKRKGGTDRQTGDALLGNNTVKLKDILSSHASSPNFPALPLTISPSYLKLSMLHLNSKVNFFKFSYVKPLTIRVLFQLHQGRI